MGVYINMEMPKGCATCQYCDRAWNKPKCKAKSVQGRFMEQKLNLDRTRQKWCPLGPVPPHGRLVDADELRKDLERRWNTNDDQDFCNKEVWKALEDAPTIIPAE